MMSSYLAMIVPALLFVSANCSEATLRDGQGGFTDWDGQPAAKVYSERKATMPAHTTQAVELLRFITAYRRGVKAFVDITPYSALLKASAETDGELNFFAFIDTWVGNSSRQNRSVMSIAGDTCTKGLREEEPGGGGQYGNGWQVDANLVFWPKVGAAVETRPRESVTISSGYYGSYSFGAITVHEGKLIGGGSQIELKEPTDLAGTLDAEVYPCPGGAGDVQRGLKMGEMARRLQRMGSVSESSIQSMRREVYEDVKNDAMKDVTTTRVDLAKRQIEVTFDVNQIEAAPGTPAFHHKDDIVVVGNTSSYTEETVVGKVISVNDNKAVVQVSGSCLPSEDQLNVPRFKLAKTPDAVINAQKAADSLNFLPNRIADIPEETDETEDVLALLNSHQKREHARRAAKDPSNIHLNYDAPAFRPFLVGQDENASLAPLRIFGQVDLADLTKRGVKCAPNVLSLLQKEEHAESLIQKHEEVQTHPWNRSASVPLLLRGSSASGTAMATADKMLKQAGIAGPAGLSVAQSTMLKAGSRVCIMARRSQGRVFERAFPLPTFFPPGSSEAAAGSKALPAKPGDHVLLQFSVTGHGWSGSTEQCGEYCHSIFHIIVNGHYAFNLTTWRGDCQQNPISNQYGTWTTARDGWCPGTVEPGFYIDMTKWLKNGDNHIAVEVTVLSSKTGKYQPYINYGGYHGGNNAILLIGATLFIYDVAAVDAIKQKDTPCTAAEKALQEGSSQPSALNPATKADPFGDSGFAVFGSGAPSVAEVRRHTPHEAHRKQYSCDQYDFEKQAPWYLYDSKSAPKALANAQIVKTFVDGLIQINSREIRVKVKKSQLPNDWSQLAVQLTLQKPGDDGVKELEDLVMDHWDRIGSFGLIYDENSNTTTDPNSMVELHPSSGPTLLKRFKLL